MKKKLTLVSTIVLAIASCCPTSGPDLQFVVANRSNDTVYFKLKVPGLDKGPLPSQWYLPSLSEKEFLAPGEMSSQVYDKSYFIHGKKLTVTFITKKTIQRLTWPVILEKDTVDSTFYYTLDELREAHYIVEYK